MSGASVLLSGDVEDIANTRARTSSTGVGSTLAAGGVSGRTHRVSDSLVQQLGVESSHSLGRSGATSGEWANPYIEAAQPLLRMVRKLRSGEIGYDLKCQLKAQQEVEAMVQKLTDAGVPEVEIGVASYLICSFVDESVALSMKEAGSVERAVSLLVQFHGDSWGGDACFQYLDHYLKDPVVNRQLLCLFEWVLALGFNGKYRILEHGDVHHDALRRKLSNILNASRDASLAQFESGALPGSRYSLLSGRWMLAATLVSLLLGYAVLAWVLEERSRTLHSEIVAYRPPQMRVNIRDLLPKPLPRLVAEGWVEARRIPQGWQLALRSDNAFATGSAELRPSFGEKLQRLSSAIAPWPGDLQIVGHTDSRPIRGGVFADNEALSLARANTVAGIVEQTIVSERENGELVMPREIFVEGRGDREPIASNTTAEGRSSNRRVDIFWLVAQVTLGNATNNSEYALDEDVQ